MDDEMWDDLEEWDDSKDEEWDDIEDDSEGITKDYEDIIEEEVNLTGGTDTIEDEVDLLDSEPVSLTESDITSQPEYHETPMKLDEDNSERTIGENLNLSQGTFSCEVKNISIGDILISEPKKKSRKDTISGLTRSVKDMGVLTPIHVAITSGYSEWLESPENDGIKLYRGYKYVLIDGLRRVYAALKCGKERIDSVVWSFDDMDYASEVSFALSLVLDKNLKHSWAEIWGMYETLEMQFSMSPNLLEYLLKLEPGDAMKLKDVVLSDYDDIKQDLFDGKKSLQQCYNTLQKYRKEEDQAFLEDSRSLADVEEASDLVQGGTEGGILSDSDVKEILEMVDDFSDDLSDGDFDGMMAEPYKQDVNDRRPLDPQLRQAVLKRDNYSCQICGMGGIFNLPTMVIHHIIEVKCGGADKIGPDIFNLEENNLVTLCDSHHILLHSYAWSECRVPISKSEYEELSDEDKLIIKKTLKFARIVYESEKRIGGKAAKAQHRMPKPYSKEDVAQYREVNK